jgi:3-deoxy-manno-octulosonate cytidylyltransferase (CMP-KDO synthetase)
LPLIEADLFVNLQGDEPMIRPADVETLIAGMAADAQAQVGTLCHRIAAHEAVDPNTVKTVLNDNGDALYFSRAAIPYARDGAPGPVYMKHIGIYAYRRELLAGYARMKPSVLEETEKPEQLRLLSAGVRIRVWQVAPTGPGVDTDAGLQAVRRLMAATAGTPMSAAATMSAAAPMSAEATMSAAATMSAEAPMSAAATMSAGTFPWMAQRTMTDSLKSVRLIITDVDGVLTDGGLYWDERGECMKRFHVRDGLGIQLLQGCGVQVAVISGRDSATLRRRIADLGIPLAAFGVRDKAAMCRSLMAQAGATAAETVFIGDDSIDLPAFEACGLSFTTADAAPYIKANATHVLAARGGAGALRELADAVLLAQGKSHIYGTAAGLLSVFGDHPALDPVK